MLTIENIEKLKTRRVNIKDNPYYIDDITTYTNNYVIAVKSLSYNMPHTLILHRKTYNEGYYSIQIYGYPLNEFSKLIFSTPDSLITTVELYCKANL